MESLRTAFKSLSSVKIVIAIDDLLRQKVGEGGRERVFEESGGVWRRDRVQYRLREGKKWSRGLLPGQIRIKQEGVC
mgnify:CR=1 FL=1